MAGHVGQMRRRLVALYQAPTRVVASIASGQEAFASPAAATCEGILIGPKVHNSVSQAPYQCRRPFIRRLPLDLCSQRLSAGRGCKVGVSGSQSGPRGQLSRQPRRPPRQSLALATTARHLRLASRRPSHSSSAPPLPRPPWRLALAAGLHFDVRPLPLLLNHTSLSRCSPGPLHSFRCSAGPVDPRPHRSRPVG